MSDIQQKREAIKKKYPGSQSWAAKVDKMSDKQVLAVHSRLSIEATKTIRRLKALEPNRK